MYNNATNKITILQIFLHEIIIMTAVILRLRSLFLPKQI